MSTEDMNLLPNYSPPTDYVVTGGKYGHNKLWTFGISKRAAKGCLEVRLIGASLFGELPKNNQSVSKF
jgi:hypothetical protein